jgi:hypothetical protein
VAEIDVTALKLELERSKIARLRAWAALGELRTVLTAAGQELPKAREKSFVLEGEILERALKKALADREEALRELAAAARSVDRAAFKDEANFGPTHEALLKALDKAARFVWAG